MSAGHGHHLKQQGLLRNLSVLILAGLLSSGCASVATEINPQDYCSIGNKNVRLTTAQGETLQAIGVSCRDSLMTLNRATYPGYDGHEYPLSLKRTDVVSLSRVNYESLIYVETGVEHGVRLGGVPSDYPETAMTVELGYLSGERVSRPRPTMGFGGTVYFAVGDHGVSGGVKARARYRFNNTLSLDLAAGPMIAHSDIDGAIASLGFNIGSYATIKSEYLLVDVDPWREYDGYTYTDHAGGNTHLWYNGVAFRNGAGWIATGMGVGTMAVITAMALAGLAGGN